MFPLYLMVGKPYLVESFLCLPDGAERATKTFRPPLLNRHVSLILRTHPNVDVQRMPSFAAHTTAWAFSLSLRSTPLSLNANHCRLNRLRDNSLLALQVFQA